jgi:transposase InsO family protein
VAKLTINELHHALGHVAQGAVQYVVKQGLIEGLKLDSASTTEFCEACTKEKATHQPFLGETANRACTYGELVHTDLWGPAQTESVTGHLYYISFTNDFSQETKVRFLKLKSEALSAFKDYEMELKRQTPGAKIKKLRSDRGGEYLSMEFDKYLKDQDIKHQLTIHHSPQQNSVAECLNHMLVEHAQAMLLGWDMPKIL